MTWIFALVTASPPWAVTAPNEPVAGPLCPSGCCTDSLPPTAGADSRTNATTQIKWGLDYIARGYGSPCAAWGHSQSVNRY